MLQNTAGSYSAQSLPEKYLFPALRKGTPIFFAAPMDRINISIAAIPAYYVITLASHFYAQMLLVSTDKTLYDNTSPRHNSQEKIKKALGPDTYKKYERAKAASTNGFESFPLFATAMLAGNFAGISSERMGHVALGVLASRVLYSIVYVNNRTQAQSFVRSGIWNVGMILSIGTLFHAALVWN